MTRKHWLLIAAITFSVALAQAACGMDTTGPDTVERGEALTTIQASQLDQDLPGCLEALTEDDDGSSRQWERVEVAKLLDAPSLGVLVVDGRQMCVDKLDEIETWMETGAWPQMQKDLTDRGEILPRDKGDVAHEQVRNFSVGADTSLGRDDDDPHQKSVDDSNPLPPYPNPIEQFR